MNEEQPTERVNSNNAAIAALTGSELETAAMLAPETLTKEQLEALEREREADVAKWLVGQIRGVSIVQPRRVIDKWANGRYLYLVFEGHAYFVSVTTTKVDSSTWQTRALAKAKENRHVMTEFAYTTNELIGYVAQCTQCGSIVNVPRNVGLPNGYAILERTCPMALETDDEADYDYSEAGR